MIHGAKVIYSRGVEIRIGGGRGRGTLLGSSRASNEKQIGIYEATNFFFKGQIREFKTAMFK